MVNRYFHPDGSATSQIASQLAAHLAGQGWRCSVLTSCQLYEQPRANLESTEDWRGVRIFRVRTSRFGRANLFGRALDYASFYLAAIWAVLRQARRGDVVIAKTDPPMLGLALALPCRLRGAVLINWLQDVFPEIAARLAEGRLLPRVLAGLQPLRDSGLRSAHGNVVVGRCMQEYLAGRGIGTRFIPNWPDEDHIRPVAHADNPLRQAWGLRESFVVGYSGNFGRAHSFTELVGAAELLPKTGEVIFLFVGGGRQYEGLRAVAQARGYTHWQFRPYQAASELGGSLAAADVHLVTQHPALSGLMVPSKWYGVAAAGRPAVFIGPPDAEIARVIAEEQCGWQLSPGDAAGLARLLTECRSDRTECRRRGVLARQTYEQRFRRDLSLSLWRQLLLERSAAEPDKREL